MKTHYKGDGVLCPECHKPYSMGRVVKTPGKREKRVLCNPCAHRIGEWR